MKTYKESYRMFKYNFSSIILFEITFKLMAAAFFIPLIYYIINLSVKLAGISYLGKQNVKQYFTSPSTYGLFVILLIILAAYFLINASGLIYVMEASHREEKIGVIPLMIKAVLNALRLINPKNWGIIVYILLVLPVTSSVMLSGSAASLKTPDFFETLLRHGRLYINIFLIVYFTMSVLSIIRIFSLNYYTLYHVNYREAKRLSHETIRRHFLVTFMGLIICNLLINGVLYLLQGTLATALAGILERVVAMKQLRFALTLGTQIIFLVLYIVFSIVSTPLIYAYVCTRFYELEGDKGYNDFREVKEKREKRKKRILTDNEKKSRERVAFIALLFTALFLNGLYIYMGASNRANLSILYPTRAMVTAHRGDSHGAPENTMSAIALAHENQADIVEVDIRQTRDGEYILMHDENMKRTTGVNKRVGDVDYAFIQELDAGIIFSGKFAGEHIPTLREILEYGKENNIFYNIELKPAGTDYNYVEGIVDMIGEYDYVDNCVLASADYDSLCKVKSLNPDIRTVYILTIVVGDVSGIENVDIFSIRYNFITVEMVKQIHSEGKEIYAWTVNREEQIKNLLLMDVDSIITDNPYNTKEIIYNANANIITDWINRLIKEY